MKGQIAGEDAYVTVIRAGRPGNVVGMAPLVGPATWYVPAPDVEAYEWGGAEFVAADSGGLTAARNDALEDAFAADLPCVQLSDDLCSIRRFDGPKTETFAGAVGEMFTALADYPDLKYSGFAPTTDERAFSPDKRIGLHHFIVGDFTLTLPSPIRYDASLKLKEDYDFTMQHIVGHGGVVRLNYIAPAFQHRNNVGGAVEARSANPLLEGQTAATLLDRWKPHLRKHPTRENEVVLHWRGS